jgi:hypothetical protein
LVFEGGGGGATQIGGASFGIGIDLEQFRRDLDTAERLAKSRAGRISDSLKVRSSLIDSGDIPPGTPGAGGRTSASIVPPAGRPFGPQPLSASQWSRALDRDRYGPEPVGGAALSRSLESNRLGPDPVSLAAQMRFADQQTAQQRAAMGPFEAPRSDVTSYRRTRLQTPSGDTDFARHARILASIRRGREREEADLNRQRATMGPFPVGGAALSRFAEQQQAAERAAMGPFQLPAAEVNSFRRARGLNALGNAIPPRPPSGGRGGGGGGRGGGGEADESGGGIFGLSPTELARVSAGLVGVGLGFNIAAGFAELLHRAVVGTYESAQQLIQAGRNVNVAFAGSARAFTGGGADQFARNPLTRGSRTEYLETAGAIAPLANQFALTNTQVQNLITNEGLLARIHGVELPQAGAILQQVLRGNLEAGQALDLEIVNQYGAIKGIGLTYQELAQAVGPAAATQRLLAVVQQDVNRQLAANASTADDTTKAMDRLGKSVDNLKTHLADISRTPFTIAVNIATKAVEGAQAATSPAPATYGNLPVPEAELAPRSPRPQQPTFPLVHPGTVTDTGLPPGVSGASAEQELAPRSNARPGLPTLAPRPYEGAAEFGPEERRAGAERASLEDRITQAKLKQGQALLQAQVAQSRLDEISARADIRRADVAGSVVALERQRLTLQGAIAPMLIKEQSLQTQIQSITRENLNLTEARLRAEQTAIGPQTAVAQFGLQRTLAGQRISLGVAEASGGGPQTVDIGQEIRNIINLVPALNRNVAQTQVEATQAQMDVVRTTAAQQAYDIGRQLTSLPQRRTLQDLQLGPGGIANTQIALAANAASAAAIERSLQLTNLLFSPDVVAAEQALAKARQESAEAAGQIANLQASVPGGPGGITVQVNLGGLTVGADVQTTLDQVSQAAMLGTLDAISQAGQQTQTRISPNVAGARGP